MQQIINIIRLWRRWFVGIKNFQDLVNVAGESAFCGSVFLRDNWNENAIHAGIEAKKQNILEFMFNVKEIKDKCIVDKDELHGILSKLSDCFDGSIGKYIVLLFSKRCAIFKSEN